MDGQNKHVRGPEEPPTRNAFTVDFQDTQELERQLQRLQETQRQLQQIRQQPPESSPSQIFSSVGAIPLHSQQESSSNLFPPFAPVPSMEYPLDSSQFLNGHFPSFPQLQSWQFQHREATQSSLAIELPLPFTTSNQTIPTSSVWPGQLASSSGLLDQGQDLGIQLPSTSFSQFPLFTDSLFANPSQTNLGPSQSYHEVALPPKEEHAENAPTLPTTLHGPYKPSPGLFKIEQEPHEYQRKTFKNDVRYLMPNPLNILPCDPRNMPQITQGHVTVDLVTEDGHNLPNQKLEILKSINSRFTEPLNQNFTTGGFSLMIQHVKAGSKFRIRFTIVYQVKEVTYQEFVFSRVFVMNNCNKSSELRNKGPPHVIGIKNNMGICSEETEVWIQGSGFADVVEVTFGMKPAKLIEKHEDVVMVLAPPRSDLREDTTVTVEVSNKYKKQLFTAVNRLTFQYLVPNAAVVSAVRQQHQLFLQEKEEYRRQRQKIQYELQQQAQMQQQQQQMQQQQQQQQMQQQQRQMQQLPLPQQTRLQPPNQEQLRHQQLQQLQQIQRWHQYQLELQMRQQLPTQQQQLLHQQQQQSHKP